MPGYVLYNYNKLVLLILERYKSYRSEMSLDAAIFTVVPRNVRNGTKAARVMGELFTGHPDRFAEFCTFAAGNPPGGDRATHLELAQQFLIRHFRQTLPHDRRFSEVREQRGW
jgi:hypothetical protein